MTGVSRYFDGNRYFESTSSGAGLLITDGAPDDADGEDGDIAIDATGLDFYGPKAAGSWGSPTSLQGPQGDPGDPGADSTVPGPTGPSGGIEVTFGANLLGTTGTRYLYTGSAPGSTASSSLRIRRTARAWSVTEMRIVNSAAGAGTGSYTISLATVDNSDAVTTSALSVSMLCTAREADASHAGIALSAGQRFTVSCVASGTINTSPTETIVTLLFMPA